MNLQICYVADERYSEQLLFSIASWWRFSQYPVEITDLGLSKKTKQKLQHLVPWVTFRKPIGTLTLSDNIPKHAALQAFYQKAQIGLPERAGRCLYLDSDIFVTSPSFFVPFLTIEPGIVLASPSAWDKDLHWTYNNLSLERLRQITGLPNLNLSFPLANAGLWCAEGKTATLLSTKWAPVYKVAAEDTSLHNLVNPSTGISDQDFFCTTAHILFDGFTPLHGSYNMQVHHDRMPWVASSEGSVSGSHIGEEPEAIRAIHYNTGANMRIPETFLPDTNLREWFYSEIRAILTFLEKYEVKSSIHIA